MDLLASEGSRQRFESYIEELTDVIGHADRATPLHDYCTGLVLPGERKSVEPMAALTAPARTAAQHQSLLHFVAQAPWPDQAVLSKVRQIALPAIEAHGAIEAWIIDDTGFPKKGRHSVGVARQYCGQLGKQDNCQAVVSLSVANHHGSLPVAHRLYLPEVWANDPGRRAKTGVPSDVAFRTKPEIALDLIRDALTVGIVPATLLADAGYGNDSKFRDGLTTLGLKYVVGIQSNLLLWKADAIPPPRTARWRAIARRAARTAGFGQGSGAQPTRRSVAGYYLACHGRSAHLTLRPSARAPDDADGTAGRGMAADRVARGRTGTDQVLAVHDARRYRLRDHGGSREITLADRTRLSGPQTGTRSWPL